MHNTCSHYYICKLTYSTGGINLHQALWCWDVSTLLKCSNCIVYAPHISTSCRLYLDYFLYLYVMLGTCFKLRWHTSNDAIFHDGRQCVLQWKLRPANCELNAAACSPDRILCVHRCWNMDQRVNQTIYLQAQLCLSMTVWYNTRTTDPKSLCQANGKEN